MEEVGNRNSLLQMKDDQQEARLGNLASDAKIAVKQRGKHDALRKALYTENPKICAIRVIRDSDA